MGAGEHDTAARRVARFVGDGTARIAPSARAEQVLLERGESGSIAVAKTVLAAMTRAGILDLSGTAVRLSAAGRAFADAERGTAGALPEGPGELGFVALAEAGGTEGIVLKNLSESPLAQLMRRRTGAGAPFLDIDEFEAGERLRADYTRGQIMPRLGANWVASVASGRRDGAGGMADLTDAALAARMRVEKAIAAVGPELSGVLIDICCYLKGLERVESERGWPARSAKIVLKSALGVLSRHYRPRPPAGAQPRLLHWGAEDYRPRMT